MKIKYNEYILEFSDEGAAEYKDVVCSDLSRMAPIYIKQELGEKATTATVEELRSAIVAGATEEMSMFGFKFKD